MRTLTPTLLSAQRKASGIPYVKVEAVNRQAGAARLDWERLYEGSEEGDRHSLTMAGDGSMIRIRISLPADNRRLYYQRVEAPGEASDFSAWTYSGQQNCIAVSAVSSGSEVVIVAVSSNRELKLIRSTNYGATWLGPQLIDIVSLADVSGLTAAVKPNGDLGVFFSIRQTLYVKRRVGGSWQVKSAWNKTTGDLSGVAAVYGSDWNLAVSGKDTDGNYRLWSLIYGDGGEAPSGTWSELREISSAPADADYEFKNVFMDRPDVCRLFYVETYKGIEAYSRPFHSRTLPDADYGKNLWLEPVPFDYSGECGMAAAHAGESCWLSVPGGVWRARVAEKKVDLSADVTFLKQETGPESDRLEVYLRNDDGRYAVLPEPLGFGCRLDISPGYRTTSGLECSSGQTYILEECEYVSSGGKTGLALSARGGWERLRNWKASCQFRFNRTGGEANVKQILEFVLARAGIRLETISESPVITGFYPDFLVAPGMSGESAAQKLLSFVPDRLFIEGDTAYLVHTSADDESVYSYGDGHGIYEGRYRKSSWKANRVTVEGFDVTLGEKVVKECVNREQMSMQAARPVRIIDRNIGSLTEAGERGEAYLRKVEEEAAGGLLDVPVNCGQQLCDVIDITDKRAGLAAERKRVVQYRLVYDTVRGEYRQRMELGNV